MKGYKVTKRISITFLFTIIFSGSALASEMSVEITSYVSSGLRTRGAELCGKVVNMTKPWVVAKVVIDANHKNPGIYNTLVGAEAKFCTSVVSNGGQAKVSLASLDGEILTPKVETELMTKGTE